MTTATLNGTYGRKFSGMVGVRAERTTLTPRMAETILAGNTKNRNVIKSYLKNLEQVIVRGEWAFNGEPVIVADTGRVLDGQHRLMACVNTGIPIDTMIVYGVDESVFPTIDRGVTRTVGNVLSIDGEDNYNYVAAALKVVFTFLKTGGQVYDGGGWSHGFSACVARETLAKHPGVRASVRDANRCNYYRSKSLLAGLHYIFGLSDKSTADAMIDVFSTGASNRDRPFNVLREHIIQSGLNRTHMGNRNLAAKTIRAFNAEVTGVWVKKFFWKPDGNFPLVVGLDYGRLESFL